MVMIYYNAYKNMNECIGEGKWKEPRNKTII